MLLRELDGWASFFQNQQNKESLASDVNVALRGTPPTIFLGGGTPTLLPVDVLHELFEGVYARMPHLFVKESEITIEANPESVTESYLQNLLETPVNRMSFGIQSFRPEILRTLERTHAPEHSHRLMALLKSIPKDRLRWSGDFIYGVPGLTIDAWLEDLRFFIAQGAQHFSAYQLTLTQGHRLYHQLPDGDFAFEWFDATRETARDLGLHPYETSNFATDPRHQSRHNLNYWHNHYFVGLGAGASGYIPSPHPHNQSDAPVKPHFGHVVKNVTDPKQYMDRIGGVGLAVAPDQNAQTLTAREALEQSLMMGLRMNDGIDRRFLAARYGGDLVVSLESRLKDLENQNLIEPSDTHLRLTWKGQAVADSVTLFLTKP